MSGLRIRNWGLEVWGNMRIPKKLAVILKAPLIKASYGLRFKTGSWVLVVDQLRLEGISPSVSP